MKAESYGIHQSVTKHCPNCDTKISFFSDVNEEKLKKDKIVIYNCSNCTWEGKLSEYINKVYKP